jgi:post-segregation antitoxin (ccd killing protein)
VKNVTISVRIPKEVKEELVKYKVEISKIVRKAIKEELKRRKLIELREVANELGEFFSKLSDEEIVKSVRESRESR